MPNRELTTSTRYVQLLEPAVVDATGRSAYIDLRGFDAVDILVDHGDVTAVAGDNNLVLTLEHADAAPGLNASYAAVPALDRTGDFTTLENGVTTANSVVGYRGGRRYLHVLVTETGAAAAVLSITAVLRYAAQDPSNAAAVTTAPVV